MIINLTALLNLCIHLEQLHPRLSVGASYDYNNKAVRTRSNMGVYMLTNTGLFETDITTVFVDAMFKYRGWSFMGEYVNRNADDPIARNSDGTPTGDFVNVGEGINLQTGYTFKNHFQILGRYTKITIDPEIRGLGIEKQYTFGLSKYIVGHKLKVQTDLSLNDFQENTDKSLLYRFQVEIHF